VQYTDWDKCRTDHVPLGSSLGLVSGLTAVLPALLEEGLGPEVEVDLWSAFGMT
jgi:hypothetical protein